MKGSLETFGVYIVVFLLGFGIIIPIFDKKVGTSEIILSKQENIVNVGDGENNDTWHIWKKGRTFDIYRFGNTREYKVTHSMRSINYQEINNDSWIPINTTIELLPDGHFAWDLGYRAWYTKNYYHAFFKPNTIDEKTVAFVYNRSYSPGDFKAITTHLEYMGYLDITQIDNPVILQEVQNSQGFINGSYGMYEDCFYDTDVKWTVTSDSVKEDIIIGPNAKSWLQSHPPSSYGLSNQDSYFVVATEITTHGLNLSYLGQYIHGNFSAWNGSILLKNALGKVKASLPVGDAYELNNESNRVKLLYRIIQHNGKIFLLSGAKVTDLNQLEFPIVIDPTLNSQVNADTDDCYQTVTGTTFSDASPMYIGGVNIAFGAVYDSYFRFVNFSVPANSIISTAVLNVLIKRYGGLVAFKQDYNVSCLDVDNRKTFSAAEPPYNNVTTENDTKWQWSQGVTDGLYTWRNTPDINSSVQEVINRTGWYVDNAIAVKIDNNHSDTYCQIYGHNTNPNWAAWLNVTYTAPDNHAPMITNPSPVNESILQSGNQILSVDVDDSEGDMFTVYWYTNASGTWELVQTNSMVGNGTYTYESDFNTGGTRYYWNVTVADEQDTNSSTFQYTTIDSVIITNITPEDRDINLTGPITLQATFTSPSGMAFNITWYNYENSTNISYTTSEVNGTHNFIWDVPAGLYQWNITAEINKIATMSTVRYFCTNKTWDDNFWSQDFNKNYIGNNSFLQPFFLNNSWFNFSGIFNNTQVDGVGNQEEVTTNGVYDDTAQHISSPRMVFTNDTHGYTFMCHTTSPAFKIHDGALAVFNTTDGGITWDNPWMIADVNSRAGFGEAIWYENWTYGDTGSKIHTTWTSTFTNGLWYNYFDTIAHAKGTPTKIKAWSPGSSGYGATSITKTENGRLYVSGFGYTSSVVDNVVFYSDDDGLTWTEITPSVLFDDAEDNCQLLPQGNDLLVLYHDTGGRIAQDEPIYNLTYNYTTSTWDTWSYDTGNPIFNIKTGLADEATWGATYNMRTRDVYISAVSYRDPYNIQVWRMNGTSKLWTQSLNFPTEGWTYDVKPVISHGNGDIYIVYNNQTTPVSGKVAVRYRMSTDNGTTWTAEANLSQVDDAGYSYTTTNFMDYRKFYAGCYEAGGFDYDVFSVANYSLKAFYNDTANITSVNIKRPPGTEWLFFNAGASNITTSIFDIYSSDGYKLTSELDGINNDISTVTNDTIYIYGIFNGTCSLDFWNVSWTDIPIWYSTFDWNTSFRNTSIYKSTLQWNVSFKNTNIDKSVMHWNTSFRNTSNIQIVQAWNVSFRNTLTAAQNNNRTYTCIDDSLADGVNASGFFGSGTNRGFNLTKPFTASNYTDLEAVDGNLLNVSTRVAGEFAEARFSLYIGENVDNITGLEVTWYGYAGVRDAGISTYGCKAALKQSGIWQFEVGHSSSGVQRMGTTKYNNFGNYIANNIINLAFQSNHDSDGTNTSFIYVDYIRVRIFTDSFPQNQSRTRLPPENLSIYTWHMKNEPYDIYVYTNTTGSWQLLNSSIGEHNGTKVFYNTGVFDEPKRHYWTVNITSGGLWDNHTYWFDSAQWQRSMSWNTSFRNSTASVNQSVMHWNVSFKNSSIYKTILHWNTSFRNTSLWHMNTHWNVSFRNSSFKINQSIMQWNISFRNTENWYSPSHWNVSFRNSSVPAYQSTMQWNVSFKNTEVNKSIMSWNVSFRNMSTYQSIFHWNISFRNSSIPTNKSVMHWNISFKNTSTYKSLLHWNVSFRNSSIPGWVATQMQWNVSFQNHSNQPPVINFTSPANNSHGISLNVHWFNFTVYDNNSDLMWNNATLVVEGCAQHYDSPAAFPNGTVSMLLAGACLPLEPLTTYSWWVNVTDGYTWTNETYYFTTIGNRSAFQWNVSFKNTLYNVSQFHWNISFRNSSIVKDHSIMHWNMSFRNSSVPIVIPVSGDGKILSTFATVIIVAFIIIGMLLYPIFKKGEKKNVR